MRSQVISIPSEYWPGPGAQKGRASNKVVATDGGSRRKWPCCCFILGETTPFFTVRLIPWAGPSWHAGSGGQ